MKILRQGLLLVGCFFLSYCDAQDPAELRRLYMNRNQFVITFPANPTTGYVWSIVSYDARQLHLIKSQYMTPDKTRRIGAAGKMVYEFEVLDSPTYPMMSVIKFKYARPWDKRHGIDKMAIVTVRKARQKPSVKIQ